MNTTLTVLDASRTAHGLTSDNQAAQALGVTRSCVSNWRRGKSHAEPELVAAMAKAAGLDPDEYALRVQADRELVPERKQVWLRCAERIVSAAAIALVLAVAPAPKAGAAELDISRTGYAFCTFRRRFRRWLLYILAPLMQEDADHGQAALC